VEELMLGMVEGEWPRGRPVK